MFRTIAEAVTFVRDKGIESIDLKFVNLFGGWHHISLPPAQLGPAMMAEGVGFDGSSTPGFKTVEAGDMVLIPDLTTAFIDPFPQMKTLSFVCDVYEADTKQPYYRDPRGIVRRASKYLEDSGIADDTSRWSPEFEFYVFDEVRYVNGQNLAYYEVASGEAPAERLDRGRVAQGTVISRQRGYHAIPPGDRGNDLRNEIVRLLEAAGIEVRYHHHEVGASGQQEIEVEGGPLLRMADVTLMVKYFVRNAAVAAGRHATFMPKPIYREAGSGMHFHQHLFKRGQPLFYDPERYGGLSKLAESYVAGILAHAPALVGLTNPSTNSFKRLVRGFEAPVNAFYSLANRSAAIRIPKYATTPDTKRIEFRPPDATCNPYLAMAAMLMAGLDGVKRGLDPRTLGFGPFDQNLFRTATEAELREKIRPLPRSLSGALDALQADHAFLLEGGVFTEDIIQGWIDAKRDTEVLEIQQRPHPYEIELYFNV
jgi:glutamine synthetase